MSALNTLAALYTTIIKKAFPDPQQLLSKKIAALATTYDSTTPATNTQTDTGIVSLTLSPVANGTTTGILVSWGASSNAIAKAWLDDTTVEAHTLECIFIPVGTTRTLTFGSAVTRWDMKAVGAACVVYQEIAR